MIFVYDDYAPAYRYGLESFARHGANQASFDSVESELGRGWENAKGKSRLVWDAAKSASRNAWNRVSKAAHELVKSNP